MFKPVNPDSRFPAFLQNGTKNNIIFQLTLTVVLIGGMTLKDWYEQRQWDKQIAQLDSY
jgi:hypothetical protein